jgi:hypothetical protein
MLMSLVFSTTGYADFSGWWWGEGLVRNHSATQTCKDLSVTIEQSDTRLYFAEINYPCAGSVYTALEYQISGQDILENKRKVGWLKADEFYIYSYLPPFPTKVELHGKIGKKEILTFAHDYTWDGSPDLELHVKAHFEKWF